MEETIRKAVKEKIRSNVDLTVHDMYIWLEGYLAGIGQASTSQFVIGSKIIESEFSNAG